MQVAEHRGIMPVEHPNRPEMYAREPAVRAADDDADRRHVVMERARELKRALLLTTMRFTSAGRAAASSGRAAGGGARTIGGSGRAVAAAYNEAERGARAVRGTRSSWLLVLGALLTGALSMLIPLPRTYSIQGQLAAADGTQPWVMVYAHPSQCAKLSLDESAVVVADAPGLLDQRYEAQITRLAPHEGPPDAPACHVTLQLLDPTSLPTDAAINVLFATQARSWLVVLLDEADNDTRLRAASTALRSYTQFAWHESRAFISYVVRHPEPQHYWGMLKELVAQDPQEQDSAAID
jgi:hypothetical protein